MLKNEGMLNQETIEKSKFFSEVREIENIFLLLDEKDEVFRKRIGKQNQTHYKEIKLLFDIIKRKTASKAYKLGFSAGMDYNKYSQHTYSNIIE